ncbi:uncharacterized protein [Periplaneta americana]|uniref:uncharacterized protein isoform X2 n=1 Tax=Periplaneta americana TaxID=6978 RepID=UPI0037E93028
MFMELCTFLTRVSPVFSYGDQTPACKAVDILNMLELNFNKDKNELLDHSRQARQTGEEEYAQIMEHSLICCQYRSEGEHHQKEQEGKITEKCSAPYTEDAHKPGAKEVNDMTCYLECLYKNHNSTDSNGDVVLEAAMKLLKSSGFNVDSVLNKVQSFCGKYSKEMTSKDTKKYTCPRQPLHFMLCVQDVAVKYCPKELWQSNNLERCEKRREELKDVFND